MLPLLQPMNLLSISVVNQHECLAAHHNSRWCSYPAHGTAPRPPEDANITSFKWRHPWQSKNTIHHLIIHQKSSKHFFKKRNTPSFGTALSISKMVKTCLLQEFGGVFSQRLFFGNCQNSSSIWTRDHPQSFFRIFLCNNQ